MSNPAETKSPKRKRWLRLGLALASLPLLGWLSFEAAVLVLPYPQGMDTPPTAGTWIEDRNGIPLAAFVGAEEQWHLPLKRDEVSPHLLQAIVAIEDRRFYQHHGVDWGAVGMAAWQNVWHGRIFRGASTLTMQVQRLRDPQARSWWYKASQAVRACQIEKTQDKDAILLEYINRAPFGGNLVGAGAASWRYFGKPCRELSLGQAAMLAGLPQSPNRYRPDRWPERAEQRRALVLDRMVASGYITPAQSDEAKREPIEATWRALPQQRAQGPAADGAMACLANLGQQHKGECARTTLDFNTQQQVAAATENYWQTLANNGVTGIAVMAVDTTSGECRATVSLGRESGEGGGVDLTRTGRSSGSVLKPFIYAAAFEAGQFAPTSVLEDSPRVWAGYVPGNYDGKFRGAMTSAEALAESRNIPAMAVLAKVGMGRTTGIMEAAGLRSVGKNPQRYGLSLAIGGAEVTMQEVAEAYATLGRGGLHRSLTFFANPQENQRVLPEWVCWQTLGAISSEMNTADVCREAEKTHVAWKTGTSSGFRDAWCAAVTRRHTVVVWVGNTSGHGVHEVTGRGTAAPLALKIVAMLEGNQGGEEWPMVKSPYVAENEGRRKKLETAGRLSIVAPGSGREIVINSEEAGEQQRVEFRASGGEGTRWWFVDDTPVGQTEEGKVLWWKPVVGNHEVRVVDGAGKAERVKIRVRG